MSAKITAWQDPRTSRAGEVTPSVSIDWREDGRVELGARDKHGREVVVVLPNFVWLRMAQEIGWNLPRRQAALSAARLGMAPEPGAA